MQSKTIQYGYILSPSSKRINIQKQREEEYSGNKISTDEKTIDPNPKKRKIVSDKEEEYSGNNISTDEKTIDPNPQKRNKASQRQNHAHHKHSNEPLDRAI